MKTRTIFTSVAIACSMSTPSHAYNTAFGYAVNTQSREDSRQFYLQQWAPDYTGPVYWTGDIRKCIAGDIAPEMRAAILQKYNILRAYAGISSSLVHWDALAKQQQEAALIQAANPVASNNPGPGSNCYTPAGAAGSKGIIGRINSNGTDLPHWYTAGGFLGGYSDARSRKMVLYPQMNKFAIGVVQNGYEPSISGKPSPYFFTTTMYDYEAIENNSRPTTMNGFISWPSPGHLPYQLTPINWHFQFPWADFTEAQVTVTTNGVELPVSIEYKSGAALVGYRGSSNTYWELRDSSIGENGIVWSMPSDFARNSNNPTLTPNYGDWEPPQSDQTFVVTIKNVKIPVPSNASPRPDWTTLDSFRRQDFTYTVTIFDPKTAGPPETVTVTEFYHAALDRYFMTGDASQAFLLSSHPEWGWKATGETFQGWNPSAYPASASPVYRFYGDPNIGPNSHFYTVKTSDYDFLVDLAKKTPAGQPKWNFERKDFAVGVPVDGKCAAENPVPVYILYNNKQLGVPKADPRYGDPNHRYVTKPALVQAMVAKGWSDAGVAMCGR